MSASSSLDMERAWNIQEPIIKEITELCDFCVEFTQKIVDFPAPRSRGIHRIKFPKRGSGSEACQLCELLFSRLGRFTLDELQATLAGGDYIHPVESSEERGHKRVCGMDILGDRFGMWADEGSAACATLVDRPPMLDRDMKHICDMIQHWRNVCRTHRKCQHEGDMPMPTRVLALSGSLARPSIQLVESRGQKGQYIALSHCWGSIENQPPRTTSTNFAARQNCIAFEDLPTTFQDAVELAQAIGIKYIWIDSLCIIQDNSRDWHSEAKMMGDVYRNATLVVAASGARDSRIGLFISPRPAMTVYKIPYRTAGEIQGTFNMIESPDEVGSNPANGPLERRAWTYQERYLARRFISFMPGGIRWFCRSQSIGGAGRCFTSVGHETKWLRLLHEYTRRSLTVPSDRTEAIRGIAEELQFSSKDQYITEFGVWKEQLVPQLLWLRDITCFDDDELLKIPSWSWAATNGTKQWPDGNVYGVFEDVERAEEMPERLAVTPKGLLQARGPLGTIQSAPIYVRGESLARHLELRELSELYDEYSKVQSSIHQGFRVLTQEMHDAYHQAVLGIARFDNPMATSYTHVGFLAKAQRKNEEDDWRHYQMHTNSLRTRSFVKKQAIGDLAYNLEQNVDFVYWVLLLEHVSDSEYRRVGMGTLFPVAYKAFQTQIQDYGII